MKKLLAIAGTITLLLSACGQQTMVSQTTFTKKEETIIETSNMTPSNFLDYQVEPGKELVLDIYLYQDGLTKNKLVYSKDNGEESSGTIALGFQPQGDTLRFKADYLTLNVGKYFTQWAQNAFYPQEKIGDQAVLISSYYATQNDQMVFSSELEADGAYKQRDLSKIKAGDVIVDIVAHTN